MIFSIEWLSDFIPVENDPVRIRDSLLSAGIRVIRVDGDRIEIEDHRRRPDLMGHLGIARELAASQVLEMKPPIWPADVNGEEDAEGLEVQILDEEVCSRFSTLSLENVQSGSELEHVRDRLRSVGAEPSSPISDVLRYVMLATGQPVHAFDRRAVEGRRLYVRRAQSGESFRGPEGREISLSVEMPVIADDRKPLALAGIVTGEHAAVSKATRDVILGSGIFPPGLMASSRRRAGIRTESSDRLERGADFGLPPLAVGWAAALLSSGAHPRSRDLCPRPYKPRTVVLRRNRMSELLGEDVAKEFVERILTALGFQLDSPHSGTWQVRIPSFRMDVERESDLIEEIARFHGVDRLPSSMPSRPLSPVSSRDDRRLEKRLREALFHHGYDEVVNPVFSDPEKEVWFGNENRAVEIRNPLDLQRALLKTTLLAGLLDNLVPLIGRRRAGGHLFEIGRIFLGGDDADVERRNLGLVTSGRLEPPHWRKTAAVSDFFHLKGTCEGVLSNLGFESFSFREKDFPCLETGRSLELTVKGEKVGFLGSIRSDICQAFGLDGEAWGAEIDLGLLDSKHSRVFPGRSRGFFPYAERVISFGVPAGLSYQAVQDVIERLALPGLEGMTLQERREPDFDSGGDGGMDLLFRFRFPQKTVTDDEADELFHKIIKALKGETGLYEWKGGKIDKRTGKD